MRINSTIFFCNSVYSSILKNKRNQYLFMRVDNNHLKRKEHSAIKRSIARGRTICPTAYIGLISHCVCYSRRGISETGPREQQSNGIIHKLTTLFPCGATIASYRPLGFAAVCCFIGRIARRDVFNVGVVVVIVIRLLNNL